MTLFEGPGGVQFGRALTTAGWMLVAFLAVGVVTGILNLRYIGTGVQASNTIQVTGHGEFLAVPDIATFTFSVSATKATVADAQTEVTTKANAITAYLKAQGIDAKDIKTTDYSIQPHYEYQTAACPAAAPGSASAVYCPPGRQTLTGYEVSQTTAIKVRDTAKAGDLLAGVGSKGATNVSGLNFTFDDPKGPQQEAREKAIADAKEKAKALSKELGVSLVRIVSFNENGYSPEPYAARSYATGGMDSVKAVAPEISVGQNKLTNDVTVTYEIR